MQETSDNKLRTEELLVITFIVGISLLPVYDKINSYLMNNGGKILIVLGIYLSLFVIASVLYWIIKTIIQKRKEAEELKVREEKIRLKNEAEEIEKEELRQERIRQNEKERIEQYSRNLEQRKPIENVAEKPLAKQRLKVKVDSEKGYFRYSNLSIYDIKYLLNRRYKEIKILNIQGKKERYMIHPRFNESAEHCFLTFNIANYLRRKVDKLEIYTSVNPDIVFSLKGKKYALEIETGKMYKTNKKSLIEKVARLNKTYGENWFFVLTDWNLSSKYAKLGKILTKRNFIKKIEKIINSA